MKGWHFELVQDICDVEAAVDVLAGEEATKARPEDVKPQMVENAFYHKATRKISRN